MWLRHAVTALGALSELAEGKVVASQQKQAPHLRWSQAPPLPWRRPGSADIYYMYTIYIYIYIYIYASLKTHTYIYIFYNINYITPYNTMKHIFHFGEQDPFLEFFFPRHREVTAAAFRFGSTR